MPVKYLADDELSPAWVWMLMTGEPAPVRLRGWVALAQSATRTSAGFDYEPAGDRHWADHGPALRAEARAHHFTPFWDTNETPTGPGFEQWRDRFLAEFRY